MHLCTFNTHYWYSMDPLILHQWNTKISVLKPCTHEHAKWFANCSRTVCELLANGLRTKGVYVWMGLQACAVPFVNGSHTVHRKSKFVGFLGEHKENWMRWMSFPSTGCPLLTSSLQKINWPCARYAPHANGAAHKRCARVYKV